MMFVAILFLVVLIAYAVYRTLALLMTVNRINAINKARINKAIKRD